VLICYLQVTFGLIWASGTHTQVVNQFKYFTLCYNNALLNITIIVLRLNEFSLHHLDHLLHVAGNMLILSQVLFLVTGCDQ
jgi:hypothetical protein